MSKEESTVTSTPAPPKPAPANRGGEDRYAAPVFHVLDDSGVGRFYGFDACGVDGDGAIHVSQRPFRTASDLQSRISQ